MTKTSTVCTECDGRGQYLDAPQNVLDGGTYWQTCHICGGTGVMPKTSTEPDFDRAEALWKAIAYQANDFSEYTSHRSDLFELLACILAFYEERGTSPEQMLSPTMRERIAFFREHPPLPERDAPEPTDHDAIARPLVEKLSDTMDPENAARFVRDVTAHVWNARGAADLATIEAALTSMMGGTASDPYVKNLERALRSLDR